MYSTSIKIQCFNEKKKFLSRLKFYSNARHSRKKKETSLQGGDEDN